MKKGIIFLIGIIALAGMFNCIVLEPAYALVHEQHEAHEQETNNHCGVVCSSCHLWEVRSHSLLFEQPLIAREFVSYLSDFSPNPPIKSIFHPPAVL